MVFSKYHESWRDHPMINNSWKKMFPGFGHAVAIFTTFVALEFLYNKLYPPSHGHGHGHGGHGEAEYEGTRYGGSYEADAESSSQLSSRRNAPPASMSVPPPEERAASSNRPRGNASSVPGGIFAPAEDFPSQAPPSSRSNKSNVVQCSNQLAPAAAH